MFYTGFTAVVFRSRANGNCLSICDAKDSPTLLMGKCLNIIPVCCNAVLVSETDCRYVTLLFFVLNNAAGINDLTKGCYISYVFSLYL